MKAIPAQLLEHYQQEATTVCILMRVECTGPFADTVLGFTTLDAELTYDDGSGAVLYRADNGLGPSRLQASADLSVDNAEFSGWVSDAGVTEEQIRAGLFNRAKLRIYRVNYEDLAAGHEIVATGRFGETRFSENGWTCEFRALTQLLREPIGGSTSITCRQRFGFGQCGKPFTWSAGTVTAVDGGDTRRRFTAAALAEAAGFFDGGVVEWLTGDNAGNQMEVAFHDDGGVLELALAMPFSVQAADTFRIRKDCSKVWGDDVNGCLFHWGSERPLHFDGEPHIPIADAGSNLVPGAQG